LGTDGFGLSESRPALRAHFEVDTQAIVRTSLTNLHKQVLISDKTLSKHLRAITK
jgi:pyruvate dehydrogenase E1 component